MKNAKLSQWQADLLAKLDTSDKISGATSLIHAAGEAMKQGVAPAQALWEATAKTAPTATMPAIAAA